MALYCSLKSYCFHCRWTRGQIWNWLLQWALIAGLYLPDYGWGQKAIRDGGKNVWIHSDCSNSSSAHPLRDLTLPSYLYIRLANVWGRILKTITLASPPWRCMTSFLLFQGGLPASDRGFRFHRSDTRPNGCGKPNLWWSMSLVSWFLVRNMVGCRLSRSSADCCAHCLRPPSSHRSLNMARRLCWLVSHYRIACFNYFSHLSDISFSFCPLLRKKICPLSTPIFLSLRQSLGLTLMDSPTSIAWYHLLVDSTLYGSILFKFGWYLVM